MNGGCNYDYIFLKLDEENVRKICDGYRGSCTILGNTLDLVFFSDGSVTRRGFECDVYITRNEDLIPKKPTESDKKSYPNTYYLYNIDSPKEVQNIRFCKCSTDTLNIQPIISVKEADGWHRIAPNYPGDGADPNALMTISDLEGNVLYTQEIHNADAINLDISNYPEDFVVCLERRNVQQCTVLLNINLTKKETS